MLREVWNGAAIGSNASGLRTHFTAAAARMPELSAADAHTLREPSHARDVIGRGTASIKDPPLRTGGLPRVHASNRSDSRARLIITRLSLETGAYLSADEALKLLDLA